MWHRILRKKSEFFGLGNKSSTEMDKLLSNVSWKKPDSWKWPLFTWPNCIDSINFNCTFMSLHPKMAVNCLRSPIQKAPVHFRSRSFLLIHPLPITASFKSFRQKVKFSFRYFFATSDNNKALSDSKL